jgi:hypothetical protein
MPSLESGLKEFEKTRRSASLIVFTLPLDGSFIAAPLLKAVDSAPAVALASYTTTIGKMRFVSRLGKDMFNKGLTRHAPQ